MLWLICIVPLVCLVYAQTLSFAMVGLDDAFFVSYFDYFGDIKNLSSVFGHDVMSGMEQISGHYRPFLEIYWIGVTSSSRFLTGMATPWVFHAAEILLHLVVTGLLWRMLSAAGHEQWAATFLTAIFAVHPVNAAAVAWICGSNEILFAMFALLAYSSLIKDKIYLFSFTAMGMLFCKESGLPLLCLFWVKAQSSHEHLRLRSNHWVFVLPFSIWATSRYLAMGHVVPKTMLSDACKALSTALVGMPAYFSKLIIPANLHTLYTPRDVAPLFPLAVTIATSVLLLLVSRKSSLILGLAWFSCCTLPTFIVQGGGTVMMREDRAYTASIGLLLTLTPASLHWLKAEKWRIAWGGSCFAAVLVLLNLNFQHVYRDLISFYGDAARASQFLVLPHSLLATRYMEIVDYDHAEEEFRKMLQINPDELRAHNGLGVIGIRRGMYAHAKLELEKEITVNPSWATPWLNLGIVHQKLGNLEQAEAPLVRATQLDPNYTDAYARLAALYSIRGDTKKLAETLYQIDRLGALW